MQVVNVRQLKSNPSTALRQSARDLVVVMNRDRPDAVLVGFGQLAGIPGFAQVRDALAVGLFRDHMVSVSMAAQVAGRSLADMLSMLSAMGVPVADATPKDLRDEAALAEHLLAARDPAR
jgi:predicted HTH domain antitoxin